ncbi:MAG: hypothetical protein LBS55_02365 [Prevotellaceae bacterium]|jgi:hypothetical protein|nr:hypothetical protein [Prevotellaceae bacterium]
MNKILTVLFALLVTSTFLPAQEIINPMDKLPHQEKNFTIAIHPFYSLNGGMRFDFEKRIKNTPSWMQFGVTGYLQPNKDDESNYIIFSGDEVNRLLGGGLDLNYKWFCNRKESLYFAGGCSYTYYNIEYTDKYWRSYTEDGLVYFVNDYGNITQKINKIGLNTYFGYQLPSPIFLFDMFVGLGYRYSFRNNSTAKLFNDSMLSLGYRGVAFVIGIRFGVKFK